MGRFSVKTIIIRSKYDVSLYLTHLKNSNSLSTEGIISYSLARGLSKEVQLYLKEKREEYDEKLRQQRAKEKQEEWCKKLEKRNVVNGVAVRYDEKRNLPILSQQTKRLKQKDALDKHRHAVTLASPTSYKDNILVLTHMRDLQVPPKREGSGYSIKQVKVTSFYTTNEAVFVENLYEYRLAGLPAVSSEQLNDNMPLFFTLKVYENEKAFEFMTDSFLSNFVLVIKEVAAKQSLCQKKGENKTFPEKGEILVPWEYVEFGAGYMRIYHPSHPMNLGYDGFYIEDRRVIRAFNKIKYYLTKNIRGIKAYCEAGRIIKVLDYQSLESAVVVLQRHTLPPDFDEKKALLHPGMVRLDYEQARRKIISKDSNYLRYLCDHHLPEYPIFFSNEVRINSNELPYDEESMIFVIKDNLNHVVIVYENALPARASIIFRVYRHQCVQALNAIHRFFASDTINKREKLQQQRIRLNGNGIIDYSHNWHTDYFEWKSRMQRYF